MTPPDQTRSSLDADIAEADPEVAAAIGARSNTAAMHALLTPGDTILGLALYPTVPALSTRLAGMSA